MKITNLRFEGGTQRARAVAHVAWEESDRPARDVYFETDARFAGSLTCDANAFAVAAAIPAMRFGERRLAVDGALCPVLVAGLHAAVRQLRAWYGRPRSEIAIEPRDGYRATPPPAVPRAACFLSGGVDSAALVRENRLQLPREHPRSFQDALLVYGVDMASSEAWAAERHDFFAFVRQGVEKLAADAGLTLVTVHTNLKFLEPDYQFWAGEFMGAGLAAIALACSGRLTDVSLGSNAWVGDLTPTGSHPLLDGYYGTASTRIHHAQAHVSRFEKVKLIADWPAALENLRVCFQYPLPPDRLNCGQCRRCVLTMLELLAAGVLEHVPSFPHDDVTADMVLSFEGMTDPMTGYLGELLPALEARGRRDLTRAIRLRLRRHGSVVSRGRRMLHAKAKVVDELYLGGRLRRLAGR